MANPNPRTDHLVKHPKKNIFTKDNQPTGKAKSEGWARLRETGAIRENILREMYKQAGYDDEGNSRLDVELAKRTLEKLFDEKKSVKEFVELFEKFIPEKKQQIQTENKTEITINENQEKIMFEMLKRKYGQT